MQSVYQVRARLVAAKRPRDAAGHTQNSADRYGLRARDSEARSAQSAENDARDQARRRRAAGSVRELIGNQFNDREQAEDHDCGGGDP